MFAYGCRVLKSHDHGIRSSVAVVDIDWVLENFLFAQLPFLVRMHSSAHLLSLPLR